MSIKKIKKQTKKMQTLQQLHYWAHKGDLESVENLRKFIAKEKNTYLRGQAECALEEASYYYYSPEDDNRQEREDFLFKKIICGLEIEIGFLRKWIKRAKKSIKTKKYKNIPLEVLESIHLDEEN